MTYVYRQELQECPAEPGRHNCVASCGRLLPRPDFDLLALVALFRDAGWEKRGGDVPSLARVIAGSRWVVTAWHDGALVGFARAISDGVTTAYVTDVVVATAHRRRGVATGLMTQLLAGRDTIQFVLRADPELQPFYRRLGFGDPDRMLRRPRISGGGA